MLLNISNGQVVIDGPTEQGTVATYSCNSGFSLVGDRQRVCTESGAWSGIRPTCIRESSTQAIHSLILHNAASLHCVSVQRYINGISSNVFVQFTKTRSYYQMFTLIYIATQSNHSSQHMHGSVMKTQPQNHTCSFPYFLIILPADILQTPQS